MALKNTKTAPSPKKKAKKNSRFQLLFDDKTATQLEELTRDQMRSVNNLMAFLVNKEWERTHTA